MSDDWVDKVSHSFKDDNAALFAAEERGIITSTELRALVGLPKVGSLEYAHRGEEHEEHGPEDMYTVCELHQHYYDHRRPGECEVCDTHVVALNDEYPPCPRDCGGALLPHSSDDGGLHYLCSARCDISATPTSCEDCRVELSKNVHICPDRLKHLQEELNDEQSISDRYFGDTPEQTEAKAKAMAEDFDAKGEVIQGVEVECPVCNLTVATTLSGLRFAHLGRVKVDGDEWCYGSQAVTGSAPDNLLELLREQQEVEAAKAKQEQLAASYTQYQAMAKELAMRTEDGGCCNHCDGCSVSEGVAPDHGDTECTKCRMDLAELAKQSAPETHPEEDEPDAT